VSRPATLTTTSYAILGLLAIKPWSTYELTQQMDRSLGRIWPRAVSKLYEEPKKLVDHGAARAAREQVGRRPRTVYHITPKGRRALAAWLRQDSAGPVLESEQLLKVFFAENGTKEDLLATLASARAWAVERNEDSLAAGRAYQAGVGPFPERAAQNLLAGAFISDFYAMVAEWADWAAEQVKRWPGDIRQARPDPRTTAAMLRRASWSESR
jgi:PadR family transcriptional regulator, regulatory protein AphA